MRAEQGTGGGRARELTPARMRWHVVGGGGGGGWGVLVPLPCAWARESTGVGAWVVSQFEWRGREGGTQASGAGPAGRQLFYRGGWDGDRRAGRRAGNPPAPPTCVQAVGVGPGGGGTAGGMVRGGGSAALLCPRLVCWSSGRKGWGGGEYGAGERQGRVRREKRTLSSATSASGFPAFPFSPHSLLFTPLHLACKLGHRRNSMVPSPLWAARPLPCLTHLGSRSLSPSPRAAKHPHCPARKGRALAHPLPPSPPPARA